VALAARRAAALDEDFLVAAARSEVEAAEAAARRHGAAIQARDQARARIYELFEELAESTRRASPPFLEAVRVQGPEERALLEAAWVRDLAEGEAGRGQDSIDVEIRELEALVARADEAIAWLEPALAGEYLERWPMVQRMIELNTVITVNAGRYGRAKMNNNFFENKLKVPATTRNWKTVNKLLEMAGGF